MIEAIHDDDGALFGFATITRDCTQQRRPRSRSKISRAISTLRSTTCCKASVCSTGAAGSC
ncbi:MULTISPECIES: hypothetical protein [Caballeronia]|uniref:hypothetical protein n=1 Tax=Caballeronia sp. GACF5 TaxID=2921746 RepID=UPI002E1144EF